MAENYTEGETGHIIDAYLDIKKPYEIYSPQFEKEDFASIEKTLGNNAKVDINNVTENLKKIGYDGIISRKYNGVDNPIASIVIFNSEQAKLTSNLNPTEDKDMRFSERDSERDYSYEALVSKSDMKLTVVGDNVPGNRADIVYQAIKNAKSVGFTNENGNAVVRVRDVDTDVIVPKRSIVHGLDRRTSTQAPVMVKIGEVLKEAIRVNELNPKSENIKNTYFLIGAAMNKNNELYIASFVVNRFSNEVAGIDVLYSANAKKESAALLPKITDKSATPTDSTISIAELLDYVNKYLPDILPESVLKHYGHDARPDGKLGESALFSDRDDTSVYDLMGETERIKKENEKFKAEVERLKERLKLERQVAKGNLVRIKNRSIQTSESQSPIDSDYSKYASNNSIRKINPKVNSKFPDMDYAYDELTAKNDLKGIIIDKTQ